MTTYKKVKLVEGVGVNDADYPIKKTSGGLIIRCPYYTAWANMLKRCYNLKYQEGNPAYRGCSVCTEWLTFTNFKAWMETQNWEGNSLDKDLLLAGNKVYGPEACLFVSRQVNSFLAKSKASRGEYPIGVSFDKKVGRFLAQCKSLGRGKEYLGTYETPQQAHEAWLSRKRELAKELAGQQSDHRISEALLNIKYEDWV